jgi:hypothetical protein
MDRLLAGQRSSMLNLDLWEFHLRAAAARERLIKDSAHSTLTVSFKVGDSIKYKKFSLKGKITGQDNGYWVIDNTLLASGDEIELDTISIPKDVWSDQHHIFEPVTLTKPGTKTPCNCDWNEVLRYGCKNANHC